MTTVLAFCDTHDDCSCHRGHAERWSLPFGTLHNIAFMSTTACITMRSGTSTTMALSPGTSSVFVFVFVVVVVVVLSRDKQ